MRKWMAAVAAVVLWALVSAAPARATPREARIPLHDGKLRMADLSAALPPALHVRPLRFKADLDLNGLRGSLLVAALNQSLGDGLSVSLSDGALVLHFDPDKLPKKLDDARQALRTFTATAAPDATAAQARHYGLHLPARVDTNKRLVVLIHGLDVDGEGWKPMATLLEVEGYQVGVFNYPDDEALSESTALFTRDMTALRETFPGARVDIVAHSMGALVARAYVEGADYAGGVDHFVMIAPPNHGSKWARFRLALEAREHYELWRSDRQWRPSWIITDGLGEAGRDLTPGSKFLLELNDLPRRGGVKYTIVAGSQNPLRRIVGDGLSALSRAVPSTGNLGINRVRGSLAQAADSLRFKQGKDDGPVSVESAALGGVDDFVLLPADHATLYMPAGKQPPLAWGVVKDRLAK